MELKMFLDINGEEKYAIICPICGVSFEFDEDFDFLFCPYCGTKWDIETVKKEYASFLKSKN